MSPRISALLLSVGVLCFAVGCQQESSQAANEGETEIQNESTPQQSSVNSPKSKRGAHSDPQPQGQWSRFRGPEGAGIASVGPIPTEWDENTNIAWKTKLPGAGTSSPIVWGQHVYLTAHAGYGIDPENPGNMDDLKRFLICLNLEDGEILWQREIPTLLPEEPYEGRMHWHGYASATPTADEDAVYAFFGKSGVFAFDHEGNELWKASVGKQHHGWGSAASPVLYEDLVIINAFVESGDLVALNRKTGEEVWRTGGLKESWNTPLLVKLPNGETELIVGIFGQVLGFNPKDGKQLWSCDAIGWYVVGSMVAHEDTVFCIAGSKYEAVAIKVGGRGNVSKTHLLWRAGKGSNVSSPIYYKGHLYFAHEGQGIAYCLDASNGNLIYETRLPRRIGYIYPSPVIVDEKLIYLSREGSALVLAAEPEYRLLKQNPALDKSICNASPGFAPGKMLLRTNESLYCISAKSGAE